MIRLLDTSTNQYKVFTRFLARAGLITGVYQACNNKTREVTDHKCGIGTSPISCMVFRYLPLFLMVLQY